MIFTYQVADWLAKVRTNPQRHAFGGALSALNLATSTSDAIPVPPILFSTRHA